MPTPTWTSGWPSRSTHDWSICAATPWRGRWSPSPSCPGGAVLTPSSCSPRSSGTASLGGSPGLFPSDVDRLRDAAVRLGAASPDVAVREVLPLAVAFCGRRPSWLTVDDLDALGEAIDSTPRLSQAMRRKRRAQLFWLRRLLFEAGMVDLPAQHRREGGPATRQTRLAAVAAPEFRRTLLAYLEVRASVPRPKTIEKLTSTWPSSASSSASVILSCGALPVSDGDTSKPSSPGPRPEPVEAATTRTERSVPTSMPTPRSPCVAFSMTSVHGAGRTHHGTG